MARGEERAARLWRETGGVDEFDWGCEEDEASWLGGGDIGIGGLDDDGGGAELMVNGATPPPPPTVGGDGDVADELLVVVVAVIWAPELLILFDAAAAAAALFIFDIRSFLFLTINDFNRFTNIFLTNDHFFRDRVQLYLYMWGRDILIYKMHY